MPLVYSLATATETREIEEEYTIKRKGKKKVRTRVVEETYTIDKWAEPKVDPRSGRTNASHDSTMDGDEVLRLTKQGVALLTAQTLSAVRATGDGVLLDLYKGLVSDRTQFVCVTKGIHQRTTKPHITARLTGVNTFHIWLSTDDVDDARFSWRAIGITATEGGAMMPACAVQGVRRRGSVSHAVLTAERLSESTA